MKSQKENVCNGFNDLLSYINNSNPLLIAKNFEFGLNAIFPEYFLLFEKKKIFH